MVRVEPRPHTDFHGRVWLPDRGGNDAPERKVKTSPTAPPAGTWHREGLLLPHLAGGAPMISFAFVKDHVRGAPLAVVVVMLVIFALDVPLIIAFTVARYSSSAGHAGSLPDVSQPA